MLNVLIELVRGWTAFPQLIFVLVIASLSTAIILSVLGLVGEFVNRTIPILFKGYDPAVGAEEVQESGEEDQ